jgi:predicted phosphate transport protein (TIGR00153 family)
MAFSFLPKEDEYFALFSQMTAKIEEAGALLVNLMNGTDADFGPLSKKIKSVEHECDELTHNITTKLNKTFITPFDREDIYTLSVALDDVCDYMDAAARAIVMYDLHVIDEPAKQLALILQKQAREIHLAVVMLKKSEVGMKQHLLEIQRLENDADEAYFNGIANLFKNSVDPVTIIKFKELFDILENGTDRCESVGNIIESIMLKHN